MIDRACFSEISARRRSPTKRCGSCWRLSAVCERLVVGGLHAVELQLAHHVEDFGPLHRQALLEGVVAGAIGDRGMAQP